MKVLVIIRISWCGIMTCLYLTYCVSADISVATGVAEGTIRNSYKDLHPYVFKIIPNWYAKEEDLKNLCSP